MRRPPCHMAPLPNNQSNHVVCRKERGEREPYLLCPLSLPPSLPSQPSQSHFHYSSSVSNINQGAEIQLKVFHARWMLARSVRNLTAALPGSAGNALLCTYVLWRPLTPSIIDFPYHGEYNLEERMCMTSY